MIQLFDSWVGVLSVADYEEFVAPVLGARPRRRRRPDDPLRHRDDAPARARWPPPAATRSASTGASRSTKAGSRSAPSAASRATSTRPLMLGPWERIEAAADDVLERAAGRPGHVFNLGHGVLPSTDPDDLARLVERSPRTRTA